MKTENFKLIKFLIVNSVAVFLPLFFVLGFKSLSSFLMTIPFVLTVFIVEYSYLVRWKNWMIRAMVLYGGMLVFLFLFGIGATLYVGGKVGSHDARSLVGMIDGSLRMIFFGHIFGIVFYPLVLLANWLFRRYTID